MPSSSRLPAACIALGLVLTASTTRAGTELIFVNGFEQPPDCTATPNAPGCPTFLVQTPTATIAPGEEVSYCYYFRTPNAATIGVKKLESVLGSAATAMFVYATYANAGGAPAEREPPGTFTTSNCGFESSQNNTFARRIYQTQRLTNTLQMPASDGAGVPVAIELLAAQPLFIELHFVNTSAAAVSGAATLSAFALADGVAYTRTAAYMTYNTQINVPPGSTQTVSANCAVPPATRFWWFSTQTHRFAINATLRSGAQTLVVTTDWQNPSITQVAPPAFFQFAVGGRLTYECTYQNPLNTSVTFGASWETNENCVGLTYFFPATVPLICINNAGPF